MTSHVCVCNVKFNTWRGYSSHARFSKDYLCRKTFYSNENNEIVDSGEEFEIDDQEDDQYMPSHNQQAMDLISGEAPHDHPSRVDNDIGDSTYLIIQEQHCDSLYGKDVLIANNLYEFHNLSKKPDSKTDIYDFVVRKHLSRKEADNFVNIIKSCASEEYVDSISGKFHN